MNSWKEVPHLFANGKFKVKIDQRDCGLIKDIAGIEVAEESVFVCVNEIGDTNDLPVYPRIENCTLIARRISDMTDEEWYNMPSFSKSDDIKTVKDIYINDDKEGTYIPYADFLYLLSVGVYPFDQSHFETREVLDVKEVL